LLPVSTPVTIITGFLGSGKTTLINRILSESHGQRIAVIENEYGETGIDAEFLVSSNDETIIQLENGCLCCTLRGDLAKALEQLIDQSNAGEFSFDRVLIETTGIADPGPIIQTFLAETNILAHYFLDSVVTLVDSAHWDAKNLRSENYAQISYADHILMTKKDITESADIAKIKEEILSFNIRSEVTEVDLNSMAIDRLINLLFDSGSYFLDYIPKNELAKLSDSSSRNQATCGPKCGHSHHEIADGEVPEHTHDVSSCVYISEYPLDLDKLNFFFDELQVRYGPNLWRYKGIVYAFNERPRLVVQGVQKLLQINGGIHWRPYEKRQSTLIFIGHDLDSKEILKGLSKCEVVDVSVG